MAWALIDTLSRLYISCNAKSFAKIRTEDLLRTDTRVLGREKKKNRDEIKSKLLDMRIRGPRMQRPKVFFFR